MEPLRGRVQKVQKVLPASSRRVQRVWYRLTAMSIYAAFGSNAARGSENHKTGLAPVGNAPLSPPSAVLLLKGSMSLDFRVASLPYKSSSFATPEGEVCSPLFLVLT